MVHQSEHEYFLSGDAQKYESRRRHAIPVATNGKCDMIRVSELPLQLPPLASKHLVTQAHMVFSFVSLGIYNLPLVVADDGHILAPISEFRAGGAAATHIHG